IATGDFNGDGRADLAWADESAGAASVLLGYGDGTFPDTPQSYATDPFTNLVTVADLNGDGKSDLVTTNGNNTVSALLGTGDRTFQAAQNTVTGHYVSSMAVADFTGDGKLDLVTANGDDDTVGVLPGNGDGSFRNAQFTAFGSGLAAVATGDFNGDGRADVAAADWITGVAVLLNTADWRTFQVSGFPSPTIAGAAHTVTVTALEGDGNPLLGYTGTVHFTSSDAQAGLPANYTFTAADNGTHTFTVTLKTAGTQSITVADT